jgi:hypothetical protein
LTTAKRTTAENIINYKYKPSLTLLAIPAAKRRREEAEAAPRGSSRDGLMVGKRTVLALFIWAMVIFMATLHRQGEGGESCLHTVYRHTSLLIPSITSVVTECQLIDVHILINQSICSFTIYARKN